MVNLRSKLDEKSVKCVFIRYATQSKAYRLFDPVARKVIISRNVVFDEGEKWNWEENKAEATQKQGRKLLHKRSKTLSLAAIIQIATELSSSSSGSDSSSESPPRKLSVSLGLRLSKESKRHAITPINTNEKLQRNDGIESGDEKIYINLVGGLNYLTHTRLDIAYCVSVVSRNMHSPSRQHLGAAKRILRYVTRTIEYGICYEPSEEFELIGHTGGLYTES
ncbi:hypothetical protein V2J09_000293 [Rumex salicifolius]